MRLRRVRRTARVEMLPLMDVVFLLLVFFIYAMLMMTVHRGMPIRLPSSTSASIEKHSVLALTVKADGSLFLDKTPVSMEKLGDILRQAEVEAKEQKQDQPALQIFAEDTLAYQRLYQVLDAVKAAGISRISLQAQHGK
ncbi:MAG: biopolymer transporter ExbD [Desulfovibrio sp.]|nr:biopolymer transporter ExbD [Desulfovibrio sp.]